MVWRWWSHVDCDAIYVCCASVCITKQINSICIAPISFSCIMMHRLCAFFFLYCRETEVSGSRSRCYKHIFMITTDPYKMEYMYCKYSEAAYVLLLLLLVQIYTILYAFGKSVYAYIFVWETVVVSIDGNLFGFRLLAFILKEKKWWSNSGSGVACQSGGRKKHAIDK